MAGKWILPTYEKYTSVEELTKYAIKITINENAD
jgi:hypothetical protein